MNLRQEYIGRTAKIRMSNRAMADFMYAIIMTKATIEASHGIGIYDYARKQNNTNGVDFLIKLHPESIAQFEELAGVELKKPVQITLN